MGKIWIRLYSDNKLYNESIILSNKDKIKNALYQACKELDISQPLWSNKNKKEWENHSLTRFLAHDFIDDIKFDYMDITYIDTDKKTKQS